MAPDLHDVHSRYEVYRNLTFNHSSVLYKIIFATPESIPGKIRKETTSKTNLLSVPNFASVYVEECCILRAVHAGETQIDNRQRRYALANEDKRNCGVVGLQHFSRIEVNPSAYVGYKDLWVKCGTRIVSKELVRFVPKWNVTVTVSK